MKVAAVALVLLATTGCETLRAIKESDAPLMADDPGASPWK